MKQYHPDQIAESILVAAVIVLLAVTAGRLYSDRLVRWFRPTPLMIEISKPSGETAKPKRKGYLTAPTIVNLEVAQQLPYLRTYRWTLLQTSYGRFPEDIRREQEESYYEYSKKWHNGEVQ